MLIIADHNNHTANRNLINVLAFYEQMINQKQPVAASQKFLRPDYFQHNPLIATGAKALGDFFASVVKSRPKFRVEVYRIIAVGDYVWAHVNFTNLTNDDSGDRGIAGVDIYRFDGEGRVAEHWDALQEVPAPATSANNNGMF